MKTTTLKLAVQLRNLEHVPSIKAKWQIYADVRVSFVVSSILKMPFPRLSYFILCENDISYTFSTKRSPTRIFLQELKIWASTKSSLKLSDFDYSEFLTSFLKVP